MIMTVDYKIPGVVETASALARGKTTAVAAAQACLDAIAERNHDIEAFVAFDPEQVLAQAARVDAGEGRGPLRGIPFAVKDVLDSAGLPTAYGSPIYAGHRPALDASCITVARAGGAVMLGKVATGEFATQTPSRARNPLRPGHTPGGSSSGSAAAVAAGMAPVAFGTQTTGSIIRPAVYCGLVGYKPTQGLIATAGLKALSPSQDTIGVITRDVADAGYFTFGLHGARPPARGIARPHLVLCQSRQWDYLQDYTREAIETLVGRLEAAGIRVSCRWLPDWLDALVCAQPRLFMFEARQSLLHESLHHQAQLSPRLQNRLRAAESVELDEYLSLRRQVMAGQQWVESVLGSADALLYPAAVGEADEGLAEAGDPRYGALPSALQLPCLSLPIAAGPTGLPLGAQLIGGFGMDARLLATAMTVESVIRRHR